MQHLISVLSTSAIYLLIALSFLVMYEVVKFFNLAHGAVITFGGYFVFLFSKQLEVNIWLSCIISLFLSGVLGIAIFHFFYRPLMKRNTPSLVYLIVSLGLYVIMSNVISMVWHDGTKSIRNETIGTVYPIFNAFIVEYQIYSILLGFLIFALLSLFLRYSNIGKKMIAISENEALCEIFGINIIVIQYFVFALASVLGAVAGILYGFDTDLTPGMGFQALLSGIIVMIVGGIRSNYGLLASAILLATAQHIGAYFINSKWMEAIAFIILILFLIWRPLGFSGKRLKKVEI